MNIIYENTIKAMGECAQEFREENMFVLFGDSAPEEIKDFCYWVDVAPIHGTIAPGQVLKVDGQCYRTLLLQIQRPDRGGAAGHHLCGGQTHAGHPGGHRASDCGGVRAAKLAVVLPVHSCYT